MGYPVIKNEKYTYADYLSWDTNVQYEIIEGVPLAKFPAPNRFHQTVSGNLFGLIWIYLRGKSCQVFAAPFDVRLAEDDEDDESATNIVQPDIVIYCDKNKLDERGAKGAPDLVIEILSFSTKKLDTQDKFRIYQRAGVKEYWIINPDAKTIAVYIHNGKTFEAAENFIGNTIIKPSIFEDLEVKLSEIFMD